MLVRVRAAITGQACIAVCPPSACTVNCSVTEVGTGGCQPNPECTRAGCTMGATLRVCNSDPAQPLACRLYATSSCTDTACQPICTDPVVFRTCEVPRCPLPQCYWSCPESGTVWMEPPGGLVAAVARAVINGSGPFRDELDRAQTVVLSVLAGIILLIPVLIYGMNMYRRKVLHSTVVIQLEQPKEEHVLTV
jgi:hypothetical protein